MVTADYAYYTDVYLGNSIPEMEFPFFANRSAAQLQRYKRIYTVNSSGEESEKMAICAMAEAFYAIAMAQNGTGTVSSASIGSVEVHYALDRSSGTIEKRQAREVYEAASLYLDIYRG